MIEPQESTDAPRAFPKLLIAVAIIYGLWFAYLAYVAWVNTQAGNQ